MNTKTNFQPGDQVRCINNQGFERRLSKGGVYTVEQCGDSYVTLKGVPDRSWKPHRFEIIQREFKETKESHEQGRKDDFDKLRYDLLPDKAIQEIVEVLTFGAMKYAPGNWRKVSDGHSRYYAALHRHLAAWRMGEKYDPESGLPHLAHAACCLVFLMEKDRSDQ